eukprot:Awhi_evm1s8317
MPFFDNVVFKVFKVALPFDQFIDFWNRAIDLSGLRMKLAALSLFFSSITLLGVRKLEFSLARTCCKKSSIGLHLKAEIGYGFVYAELNSPGKFSAQKDDILQYLIDYLDDFSNTSNNPLIISGDLNTVIRDIDNISPH